MKIKLFFYLQIIFLLSSQFIYAECYFKSNSFASFDKSKFINFVGYVSEKNNDEALNMLLSGKILTASIAPLMCKWILTPIEVDGYFIKVIAYIPYTGNTINLWTSESDIYCR